LLSSFLGTNSTTGPESEEGEGEEEGETELPVVDENALKQLVDMGFAENRSRKALIICKMNPETAMEWMLQHEQDEDIDEPLKPDDPRIPRDKKKVNKTNSASFVPNNEAIQNLKAMGFQEEGIINALKATNNNQEAACEILLGGDGEPEEDVEELAQSVFNSPILQRGLTNPRVMAALKQMIENPASAAQFVADPEIGPILLEIYNLLQHS
jgi:Kip1 ubiquitination-promoting complex protein 2